MHQSTGQREVMMAWQDDGLMAPVRAHARCDREGRNSRAALAALVAMLERALLAAQEMLDAPDTTPYFPNTTRPQVPALAPIVPGYLSTREREVLRLLATGHSNRRIAQTLFLSPRTVQRHVANLYPKIGAHCRAEATAYALRHDLA